MVAMHETQEKGSKSAWQNANMSDKGNGNKAAMDKAKMLSQMMVMVMVVMKMVVMMLLQFYTQITNH